MPWCTVWINALTKPSVPEYQAIVSQPNISIGTASLWVFAASAVGYFLTFAILAILPDLNPFSRELGSANAPGLGFGVVIICLAPVAAAFSLVGLYLTAGISHIVARALGGIGTYTQLVYAIAAYSAPISLLATFIGLIPIVNCLSFPIGIYALFLNVLSVKAVHRFGWGKAFLSSAFIVAIVLVLAACLVIGILALLGPSIGTVFSNIITEMATPTP
jgi:MFS family permease